MGRFALEKFEKIWDLRDPFAGEVTAYGVTLKEAIEDTYKDIPACERPTYVWYRGEKLPVPGGTCTPV